MIYKPLKQNVMDLRINVKSHLQLLSIFMRFAKNHGVSGTLEALKRYPWMIESLMSIESFFTRIVKQRTGFYRESNTLVIKLLFDLVIELIDGLLDYPEEIVLHEDMVPPEILMAMGLKPWMAESIGIIMPLLSPTLAETYIDATENRGIAPDTCSLPKATMGAALMGHLPSPSAIVSSNLPCDGGMASYLLIEKELKAPIFRLDIPHHFKNKQATNYFVGELKRMIAWLEENTPGKMDWDRLREICERRNRAKELELELWDMLREKPAPMAGEPIIYGHLLSMQLSPGSKFGVTFFNDLVKLANKIRKNGQGALPDERFRALLWNPTPPCFPDIYHWCEKTYGLAFLMDMLSFQQHDFIDTSSRESILEGLAQMIMEGPMARHTRGPCENFFDDIFYIHETFNLDMIFMAEHVGCKNTKALNGMFRDLCRKKNIPVFFLQYDLCDSRVAGPENMKKQIEVFMETIMKAERLDR